MTDRLWILGAADPEMEAIEKLLRECGETVAYATSDSAGVVRARGGERCTLPAEIRSGYHGERVVPPGTTWYAVECDVGALRPRGDPYVVIDHHRPGDPGYGRPPSEFLAASSLGQVISRLARMGIIGRDWWPDEEGWPEHLRYLLARPMPGEIRWIEHGRLDDDDYWAGWIVHTPWGWRLIDRPAESDPVLVAAADHCLGAAYRGECPGVDPDELMPLVRFTGAGEDRVSDRSYPVVDAKTIVAKLEAQGYTASWAPDNDDRGQAWIYAYQE